MTLPTSGRQRRLRHGAYQAVVAGVGATLRTLTYGGRDVVVPFAADEVRPEMRGALLLPWTNRTAGGRYRFGGEEHQLPVNEPEHANAAHGLLAWQGFEEIGSTTSSVRLTTRLEPQPGYPWRLHVEVEFGLDDRGLSQEVTVTNESRSVAPLGIGGHPYVLAGPARARGIDAWSLQVPAEQVLRVGARLLPTDLVAVAEEPDLDFRVARRVGETVVNHAFTDLHRDADGRGRVLVHGEAWGVEVSSDARCPWVQVYTADLADAGAARQAIAVEPMTCPPDAFNSGRDLVHLAPGGHTTAGWRIAVRPADK